MTVPIALLALAVAVAAATGHEDEAPLPPKPDGREILHRMSDAYAGLNTYVDEGMVRITFIQKDGPRVTERPFRTAFVRPERFRFEYSENECCGQQSGRYIVWRSGSAISTWWAVGERLERPDTLDFALAGATGVSGGSAHTVPRLLLPSEISGWSLEELEAPERIADDVIDSVECYRVRGRQRNDPVTVWISKDDYLIRRIDSTSQFKDFSTEERTTYEPVGNAEVSNELLSFAAPSSGGPTRR